MRVDKTMHVGGEALLCDGSSDFPSQALHVCNVVVGDKVGCEGQVPCDEALQESPCVPFAGHAAACGINRPAATQ